jgi:hypothetical protein
MCDTNSFQSVNRVFGVQADPGLYASDASLPQAVLTLNKVQVKAAQSDIWYWTATSCTFPGFTYDNIGAELNAMVHPALQQAGCGWKIATKSLHLRRATAIRAEPVKADHQQQAVHMLGVHGTGMCPVSLVALRQGYDVRGSDDNAKPVTSTLQHLGVKLVDGGLKAADLPDLVVASSALRSNHPDLKFARWAQELGAESCGTEAAAARPSCQMNVLCRENQVPILSREQWFRKSLHSFCQVAVAGTHGKTTTASLIAYILHGLV